MLQRLGFEPEVRYVEGPRVTAENLADFSWYDWVDTAPLVVATEGDALLGRWDMDAIKTGLTPKVRNLLKDHPLPAAAPHA